MLIHFFLFAIIPQVTVACLIWEFNRFFVLIQDFRNRFTKKFSFELFRLEDVACQYLKQ